MVVLNRNWRFSPVASGPNPMAERARRYFVRHPDVAPEEFLLEAVGRELTRREGLGTSPRPANRPPLTEEDLRIHVWLNERLAALHRERHGLWRRVRRFFLGS